MIVSEPQSRADAGRGDKRPAFPRYSAAGQFRVLDWSGFGHLFFDREPGKENRPGRQFNGCEADRNDEIRPSPIRRDRGR